MNNSGWVNSHLLTKFKTWFIVELSIKTLFAAAMHILLLIVTWINLRKYPLIMAINERINILIAKSFAFVYNPAVDDYYVLKCVIWVFLT